MSRRRRLALTALSVLAVSAAVPGVAQAACGWRWFTYHKVDYWGVVWKTRVFGLNDPYGIAPHKFCGARYTWLNAYYMPAWTGIWSTQLGRYVYRYQVSPYRPVTTTG